MLQSLSIHNIVLIEQLDITLDNGLVVLTGETGAGKSIILDSLGFVLGARRQSQLLRHGTKQGSVSAVFDITRCQSLQTLLEEHAIEHQEQLILRRVLYADGKSKAFINDIPVSITLLHEVGEYLVEIHGQHDQRQLFEAATHRMLLDAYGQLTQHVSTVQSAYDAFLMLQQKYNTLETSHKQAVQEEEYLRFVLRELEALHPQKGEEAQLSEQRSLLMHRDKFCEAIQTAQQELTGRADIISALSATQRALEHAPKIDGLSVESITQALESALAEVNEAIGLLQDVTEQVDMEDQSLETIQERLFALKETARKYHVTVDELPDYQQGIADKIASIETQDSDKEALQQALEKAKQTYLNATQKLTEARKKTAKQLEKSLVNELAPLKMADTYFNVAIDILPEKEWSRFGVDRVRFLASTNPGTPPGELSKIASGGELSRFMLALKVVLADIHSVPTLIFDEIDTGIGGAVADAVGKRLELLGKSAQVFVVTHQPQVAARGISHFRVKKMKKGGETYTTVLPLNHLQRKEELARMLAGETITKEARAAAEKLLEKA